MHVTLRGSLGTIVERAAVDTGKPGTGIAQHDNADLGGSADAIPIFPGSPRFPGNSFQSSLPISI